MTGLEAARQMSGARVKSSDRPDYYDGGLRIIVLNSETAKSTAQSALLRAAHEAAHFLQDQRGDLSYVLRVMWPRRLLFAAAALGLMFVWVAQQTEGRTPVGVSVLSGGVAVGNWLACYLVRLWNERRASRMAYEWLDARHLIKNREAAIRYLHTLYRTYVRALWG